MTKTKKQRADMKRALGLAIWLREWAAHVEIAPPEFFRVLDAADAERKLGNVDSRIELLRMIDDAAKLARRELKRDGALAGDPEYWVEHAWLVIDECHNRRLAMTRAVRDNVGLLAGSIRAACNPGGQGQRARASKAKAFKDLCRVAGLGTVEMASVRRDRRRAPNRAGKKMPGS